MQPSQLTNRMDFRLAGLLVVVLAFALTLVAILNICTYGKICEELVLARYRVVAEDIRGAIEYGLNLGLSPREIPQVQSLIDDEIQDDSRIETIAVIGTDELVYYSTHPADRGKRAPESWLRYIRAQARGGKPYRSAKLLLALPLRNGFGLVIGHVFLSCSRESVSAALWAAVEPTVPAALLILVVLTLAGAWGLRRFARQIIRPLGRMGRQLESLKRGSTVPPPPAGADDLEGAFHDFVRRSRQIQGVLRQADRQAESETIRLTLEADTK